MKIAYLCSDTDIEVFGHHGCSVHIREFTNALIEAGHEVSVLCARAGDRRGATTRAAVHELVPRGLDAMAWRLLLAEEPVVGEHRLARDLGSVLWNTLAQREGAEILERERPDVLYERYCMFGWAGVELSRRFDIPLILEVNAPDCMQMAEYEHFTLKRTAELMEGEILRSGDALVVLSQWLKDWTLSLGVAAEKVRVIPDGVSEKLFAAPGSGDRVRTAHGLTGKRVIGFVGGFHPWHDVKGLLRVFDRLHATDPDLRLLLVGDGERRNQLEQAVSQRGLSDAVTFTGRVPHERVPEHIAAMDIAVVPYGPLKDFYFSPLKLFECMAAGRPTVAAALGQITEVVEHGQTGWLYPPGDDDKLSEAIQTLLNRPGLAKAIGERAKQTVLSRYTWRSVTASVIDIAHELLEHRPAANSEGRTGRRS